ncbi:unnamed protein product, partial [Adineta ricciae]
MSFFRKFYDTFNGKDNKLSEPVKLIGHIFDEHSEGILFYDFVLTRFENFDQINQDQENKTFSNDFDFIVQCVMTSLTTAELSKKFSARIDAYLYMFRRIVEYLVIIKRVTTWTRSYEANVKALKEKIYELLSKVFIDNKGLQPNLSMTDKDQLRKMDVLQHLEAITKIDAQTLPLFFAFIKLSFQASLALGENLQWKRIISNVQDYGIPLQEFVSKYIDSELAFRQFPLDLPGFIELINKKSIPKNSSDSPFNIFIRLCRSLNLKADEFFGQFRPVFENGLRQKSFTFPHISSFLCMLGGQEIFFDQYLSSYAANVDLDDLWTMFLRIVTEREINDIIQKHLASKLMNRTMNTSISNFKRYTKLVIECKSKVKEEYRSRFLDIYGKVFHGFINKQLTDEQYSYKYSNQDLVHFLSVGLELSTTHDLQQPSCLLILHRLLFQMYTQVSSRVDKIQRLFQNLSDFDQDLCEKNDPISIIKDEWLEEFLLRIPDDLLLNIKSYTYTSLCDSHHNNRWTIYVWKRIIHLSILRSKQDNANDVLYKLNEWLKVVQHNVYNKSDTLTILLVINLFEMLIVKYTKSVLSLPNIEVILSFVENIRQEEMYEIDTKQLDEFMTSGQKSIENLLLLKGSCSTYRDLNNSTIAYFFLPKIDIQQILTDFNPQQYKFPSLPRKTELFISFIPKDIIITLTESKEEYFKRFLEQVNEWLQWFDRFLTISLYIIEWLKNLNVDGAAQLLRDIHNSKDNTLTTVIQMKTIVERILKLFQPFNDLQRLCHLFNCLTSFQMIDAGELNTRMNSANYIRDLKRLQPNNSFHIPAKATMSKSFPIQDRQHVQWSIASDKFPCDIEIQYSLAEVQGDIKSLYTKKNVAVEKHVLQGEFETQRAGQLVITIDNEKLHNPRTVWYRIIQTQLSTCHLFHGIFNMFSQKYHKRFAGPIKEKEIAELLDKVFQF